MGPWIRALIGDAQPFHGWWAPVAQRHKKGGEGRSTRHEVYLRGGAANDGNTATGHRRLCTVATATALSPLGFTAPPTSNLMASSSSTKAADGLHLRNLSPSPSFSLFLVLVYVLGFYTSSNVSRYARSMASDPVMFYQWYQSSN